MAFAVFYLLIDPAHSAEKSIASFVGMTVEDRRMYDFFEESRNSAIARWPQWQTSIGIKKNYDKWNDYSDARSVAEHNIRRRELNVLIREFDYNALSHEGKLSYDLFRENAQRSLEYYPFRFHHYTINHLRGSHTRMPTFLRNRHRIDTERDATDYIARLNGAGKVMDQVIDRLRTRADKKIYPPAFVYPKIRQTINNIVSGYPFEQTDIDNTLLADFKSKVEGLKLDNGARNKLVLQAQAALLENVRPAYRRLLKQLNADAAHAKRNAGVWALPAGEEYYAMLLRNVTTTNLTPRQVHDYGLREVSRIQNEMMGVAQKLGFRGGLKEFFEYARTAPENYYSNTSAGRDQYLADTDELLSRMKEKLPGYFGQTPIAALVVKPVETYRAATANLAFYNRPSKKAKRPGIYYVNLRDMHLMPKYNLAALAFHEGLPGHHMQISLAQEQTHLPKFRQFGGYTAYTEGWALYSERLAKEMGFYQDNWSDFGRLTWELLRAARMVVDTGIHAFHWSREQAVDYLNNNISQSPGVNQIEVDRYFVWPAQATAYKIGMRAIMELRLRSENELADKFNLSRFHDQVLKNGALPLSTLEQVIDAWIARQKAKN
jgi:uncharacterized protein (DUF885 family)